VVRCGVAGDPIAAPFLLAFGSHGAAVVDMHPDRLRVCAALPGIGRVVDCASSDVGGVSSHLTFVSRRLNRFLVTPASTCCRLWSLHFP
jgi:hypothetical protein